LTFEALAVVDDVLVEFDRFVFLFFMLAVVDLDHRDDLSSAVISSEDSFSAAVII